MQRSRGWTRRDLLKGVALAAPVLAAAPGLLRAEEPKPVAGKDGRGPQKVIVVGAGLAGLAAAYELQQLGHAVTVLEAQKRAGGRVHTLREPFADGLYVEAGAIDFSASYRHMVRYVKTFNLTADRLDNTPLASVYHMRGKKFSVRWGPGAKDPDWPFELGPQERKLGLNGMFQKYFAVVDQIGDPTLPGWRLDPWKSLDQLSVADFLRRQGASNEAIEMLSDSVAFGYGWSTGSALHRLISDLTLFYLSTEQAGKVIRGGTDLLPKAFVAALGDRVRYGVPVVKVLQQPGKVRVVFANGGREEWLDADRVVCTSPVPALRKIDFGPELPAGKRQAIERLEYTPVTRIYLQAKRRFWRDAGDQGTAQTDLPIRQVYEYPFAKAANPQSRGILECHLRGADAVRAAKLDPAARIAFALAGLEKVHPGFKEGYEVGTSFVWGDDPWFGGGYAEWKPGQLTDWMPKLAEAEGRVHFAGEHTSLLGRTMEGALESGNRAAREVHEAPRPISPNAD
jgi:monoamine oxidase